MKLSATQKAILSAAAQRSTMLALPLPKGLKGSAAQKAVAPLLAHGLLEEIDADTRLGEPIWRETDDGRAVTLALTEHGIAAIGLGPKFPRDDAGSPAADTAARPRTASKQAQLIAMLKRPEGASIEEIVAAFGWQAHTVRGAIAGALKKKLGLAVTSEKVAGRGRVYRLGREG
jgi:hypothetical protein